MLPLICFILYIRMSYGVIGLFRMTNGVEQVLMQEVVEGGGGSGGESGGGSGGGSGGRSGGGVLEECNMIWKMCRCNTQN